MDGDLEDALDTIDDAIASFDLEEAEETLETARQEFGPTPALLARKAELALERGDYRACLELVDRADPDRDEVAAALLTHRGYALFYLDREDEARGVFNDAVRRDPERWNALLGRAIVHEYLGFPRAARLDLDRAIELDDQEPEPFAIRGDIRAEAGDLEGARDDLERTLELDPYDEEARLQLARIEAVQDEPSLAIETLQPLVEEGEDPAFAHPGALLRSQMLLNLKDVELALEDAEVATELKPDEPWGYLQIAACHLTASRPEEALEALDRAESRMEEPRRYPDYFELRAAACEHLGRESEAADHRQRVEGPARLPEIVYGSALNPAEHAPVEPGQPFDVRDILEELFGHPSNAPEGYADKLRNLLGRVSEAAEQNPGAEEIEIELPPIEEGGPSPGDIVLQRGEQQQM